MRVSVVWSMPRISPSCFCETPGDSLKLRTAEFRKLYGSSFNDPRKAVLSCSFSVLAVTETSLAPSMM